MPEDPVCGEILNKKTAKFKFRHEGETYHFRSVKCQKILKRNWSRFIYTGSNNAGRESSTTETEGSQNCPL